MIIIPIVCSDRKVQAFIAEQMMLSPYSVPEFQRTPVELIEEAAARFGGRRCRDLAFWIH
jgi:hypothetical protein